VAIPALLRCCRQVVTQGRCIVDELRFRLYGEATRGLLRTSLLPAKEQRGLYQLEGPETVGGLVVGQEADPLPV
jgi:hypothetical protein